MCWWAYECSCPMEGCGKRFFFGEKFFHDDGQHDCGDPSCSNKRARPHSLGPTDLKPYEKLCEDCLSAMHEDAKRRMQITEYRCDICNKICRAQSAFDDHFSMRHSWDRARPQDRVPTMILRQWKTTTGNRNPPIRQRVADSDSAYTQETASIATTLTQDPPSEVSTHYGQSYSESGPSQASSSLVSKSTSSNAQSTRYGRRELPELPLATGEVYFQSPYSSTISVVETSDRLRPYQSSTASTETLPPLRANPAYTDDTDDDSLPPMRMYRDQSRR